MIHVYMMQVSMMHVYVALVHEPWCIYVCVMYTYLWSLTLMHVCMMHGCMMHVSTIVLYIWSLIPMHVCMMRVWKMHISVICDLDACIYDAGFFCYQRTNEPTNKAILGVGLHYIIMYRNMSFITFWIIPKTYETPGESFHRLYKFRFVFSALREALL